MQRKLRQPEIDASHILKCYRYRRAEAKLIPLRMENIGEMFENTKTEG